MIYRGRSMTCVNYRRTPTSNKPHARVKFHFFLSLDVFHARVGRADISAHRAAAKLRVGADQYYCQGQPPT